MAGLLTPLLAALIAAALVSAADGAAAAPQAQGCAVPPSSVEQAIVVAASAHMRAQYPEIFDRAVVRRIEGDWARVRVVTRVETEPTSLVLHRTDDQGWTVVQGPAATGSLGPLPGSDVAVYQPCSALTPLGAMTEDGRFAAGAGARIRGALGDGLPVRDEPSPSAAARALLPNDAPVVVTQGPLTGDGYPWYAVRYDAAGSVGWVGEPFLAPDAATAGAAALPATVRAAPAPAGSTLPRAEVGITVDRGPGASYAVGDPIRLCVAVSRPSVVRLIYRVAAAATTDAWEGQLGEGQITDRWCSDTVVRQALGRETLRADLLGADGEVVASDAVTYRSEAPAGAASPASPPPATRP
jgi:hypothetical protein